MSAKEMGPGADGVLSCPKCGSQDLWRHGESRAGKRQWMCKSCRRTFVENPYNIPPWVKIMADRMLVEDLPVAQIARVLDGYVGRRWIYNRKVDLSA